jgi:hypothetical protein
MSINNVESLALEVRFKGNPSLMPPWREAIEEIAKTSLKVDEDENTLTLIFGSVDQKSAYLSALNDGHTWNTVYHRKIDEFGLSHLVI